jgi:hypothetical protein
MFKEKKIWKQKFAFKQGGAPRLELYSNEGEGKWKNVSVRVDGKEIGRIENPRQVKRGVDFHLEDGSILSFKKNSGFRLGLSDQPCIFINGKLVPGSDAWRKFVGAYRSIFMIASLKIYGTALPFIMLASTEVKPNEIGLAPPEFSNKTEYMFILFFEGLIVSTIYIVLGFLVKAKSKTALMLSITLCLIEIFLAFSVISMGGRVGDLFWSRLFLIGIILQGFQAIAKLKSSEHQS